MALLDTFDANPCLQGGATEVVHIPFVLTTNGSGTPTLLYDYDGLLTVTRSTNQYTLNFGAQYKACYAVVAHHSAATLQIFPFPSSGTVTLAYGAAQNNVAHHGVVVLDVGYR